MEKGNGLQLRKIKGSLKKWFPKPPSKFNKRLVNDIHHLIIDEEVHSVLPILKETAYFEHVLWRFFHIDATLNHMELLLFLVMHSVAQGEDHMINRLIEDQDKFEEFMKRLFTITIDVRKEVNFRLHRHGLLFVSQLISLKRNDPVVQKSINELFDIGILRNLKSPHCVLKKEQEIRDFKRKVKSYEEIEELGKKSYLTLKQRWIYSITVSLMQLILDGLDIKEEPFSAYITSLIQLLFIFVSQPYCRFYVRNLIKEVGFISCFKLQNDAPTIYSSLNVLKYYIFNSYLVNEDVLGDSNEIRFYDLQKKVYRLFAEKHPRKVEEFVKIPSIYNSTPEDLGKLLSSFDLEELLVIINEFQLAENVNGEFLTHEFAINTLLHNTFAYAEFDESLSHFVRVFTEVELFDQLPKPLRFPIRIPCTPPVENAQFFSFEDYMRREHAYQYYELREKISDHIVQVLDRCKINCNNKGNLDIKGSSKYFAKIENMKKASSQIIQFSTKETRESNDVHEKDLLIAIEIIKPNKYSPHERIRNYGLNSIRLLQVIECKKAGSNIRFLSYWGGNEELATRMNYLIRLPNSLVPLNIIKIMEEKLSSHEMTLPRFIERVYLGINDKTSSISDTQTFPLLKLNTENTENISLENLPGDAEEVVHKRRKTNNGLKASSTSSISQDVLHSGDNLSSVETYPIDDDVSEYSLNKEETEALISSLSTGLTVIDAPPHSEHRLFKSIFRHLRLNFNLERVLVIASDENYLHCLPKISQSSFVLSNDPDSNIPQALAILNNAKNNLTEVQRLASSLNLGDFGYGESCGNASILFDQVKEQWNKFLQRIKQDRSNIDSYPFSAYSNIEVNDSDKDGLQEIVNSYSRICSLFYEIQKSAPLFKLLDNAQHLVQYLVEKYCSFVYASPSSLQSLGVTATAFESVVAAGPIDRFSFLLPLINNRRLKRLVVTTDARSPAISHWKCLGVPAVSLFLVDVRPELVSFTNPFYNGTLAAAYTGPSENPGFVHTHQCVLMDYDDESDFSVDQAEYAIAIYNYMQLLNYPQHQITVVVFSRRQQLMVQEVAALRGLLSYPHVLLANCCLACPYLIVCCASSSRDSLQLVFPKASRGLYILGHADITGFPTTPLLLAPIELPGLHKKTHRQTIHSPKDMVSYIDLLMNHSHVH